MKYLRTPVSCGSSLTLRRCGKVFIICCSWRRNRERVSSPDRAAQHRRQRSFLSTAPQSRLSVHPVNSPHKANPEEESVTRGFADRAGVIPAGQRSGACIHPVRTVAKHSRFPTLFTIPSCSCMVPCTLVSTPAISSGPWHPQLSGGPILVPHLGNSSQVPLNHLLYISFPQVLWRAHHPSGVDGEIGPIASPSLGYQNALHFLIQVLIGIAVIEV